MTDPQPQLTIDKLLAATPEMFKPLVIQYGPGLIAMTAEEFSAWINLLIMGRNQEAWRALLAKLPNADLMAQWDNVNARWEAADGRNADRINLQKEAVLATLKVLLMAALSMVGL